MRMVLEEKGINASRMSADGIKTVLVHHEDFQNEK